MGDEVAICQPSETHQRVRHTQPVVTTTVGQLKRLRDKFDFANSTTTQLHVETTFLLCLPIDLLLRESHTFQRRTDGHVRSKDLRCDRFFEVRKELSRTGRSARTNQHLPFPILCRTHVVTSRFLKRTRQRAIASVWT